MRQAVEEILKKNVSMRALSAKHAKVRIIIGCQAKNNGNAKVAILEQLYEVGL